LWLLHDAGVEIRDPVDHKLLQSFFIIRMLENEKTSELPTSKKSKNARIALAVFMSASFFSPPL
jgi:hypothetical protein